MKKLIKRTMPGSRHILIITMVLLLSLAYRHAYSQDQKISVDFQQTEVKAVLEHLMKQTSVNFIYNVEEVNKLPKVTLRMENGTLEEVLEKVFEGSNIGYSKMENTIVIGPKETNQNNQPPGFKQTLRGRIYDKDSRAPLSFATVQVITSTTPKGAITDIDGNFNIPNLPVGRHAIKVTFVGYEDGYRTDILLGTGKETIIEIALTEKLESLNEVVVTASNGLPLNEMASVSAKSFDAEETKRYAASISDPARMVQVMAGVSTTDDASNEIVIRGNSPNWMLWKLEGVEIPSPNHFAEEGYSSGAVSILSSNMLGNSDFYTGAFSADYGNALSGIFDLKLRNGNNQEYEHTFQAGVLGFDFASEGPFKKGYTGSYLFNYRYSTLSLLNALNFEVSENALPNYQDLSFKVNLPTKNAGTFSIWGIGGLSDTSEKFFPDSTEVDDYKYGYRDNTETGMHAAGITHTYFFENKAYIESVLSHSNSFSSQDYEEMDSLWRYEDLFYDNLNKSSIRLSSTYNRKFNNRLTMRAGMILSKLDFDYESRFVTSDTHKWEVEVNSKGTTYLYQGFVMGKYRFSERLDAIGGFHYSRFALNNDQVIEPRLSFTYELPKSQKLTFGYGRHSRHETLPVYFVRTYGDNGEIFLPNKSLDLTRASHYVLGYGKSFSKSLQLKLEAYIQHIDNLPVANNSDKYHSPIFGGFDNDDTLANKGQARNIGLEFTLQRFFSDGYYFLITSSLFDAKYRPLDGKWYNSRYNLNYINNFVAGKEFDWGENKRVGFNVKTIWSGGRRQFPVDITASKQQEETVLIDDQPWAHQTSDYFRIDLGAKIHFYKNGKEQVISLDIQNATNRFNTWGEYYNSQAEQMEKVPMAGLIPILTYRLEF